MRFVHYGLTSITFEFLTNAVEQKCKTFVSKIALFVKEFPNALDLLVHDFDDSLFTRRATCQTKIAHVLDDYNLALARASRRFQLYQPNYARSCSQEGTYIHTYIHTWIRPTAMLRCRRRDNVIEMHLRLTSLPWCWWVDNRTLIRRTTTYIHTCTWSSEQLIRPSTYIHTYIHTMQKVMRDNVIEMHLRLTALLWCSWVDCRHDCLDIWFQLTLSLKMKPQTP